MTPSGPAAAAGRGPGTGRAFGSGWISGVLAVTCAALGYGGVLGLLFPDWLVTPAARAQYPLWLVRFLIHVMLVIGFGRGALSAVLRRRKTPGLTAIALATAGTLLGGSAAEGGAVSGNTALGLDWLLLNLFVLALLFVPLERLLALHAEQSIVRAEWTTDLMHFAASHLLVHAPWLEWPVVTPWLHHWHHAAHAEALDRNFAVHLPALDRLFGAAHFPPGRWPEAYGSAGHPVPGGYWSQHAWPFRGRIAS